MEFIGYILHYYNEDSGISVFVNILETLVFKTMKNNSVLFTTNLF